MIVLLSWSWLPNWPQWGPAYLWLHKESIVIGTICVCEGLCVRALPRWEGRCFPLASRQKVMLTLQDEHRQKYEKDIHTELTDVCLDWFGVLLCIFQGYNPVHEGSLGKQCIHVIQCYCNFIWLISAPLLTTLFTSCQIWIKLLLMLTGHSTDAASHWKLSTGALTVIFHEECVYKTRQGWFLEFFLSVDNNNKKCKYVQLSLF